jgi:hypothetical protein
MLVPLMLHVGFMTRNVYNVTPAASPALLNEARQQR